MEDASREDLEYVAKIRFPNLYELTTCVCVRESLTGENVVDEPFEEQTKARDELLSVVRKIVGAGVSEGDVVQISGGADSLARGCIGIVKSIDGDEVTCGVRSPMSIEFESMFTVKKSSCGVLGTIKTAGGSGR